MGFDIKKTFQTAGAGAQSAAKTAGGRVQSGVLQPLRQLAGKAWAWVRWLLLVCCVLCCCFCCWATGLPGIAMNVVRDARQQ